jgi:hypothetical protein
MNRTRTTMGVLLAVLAAPIAAHADGAVVMKSELGDARAAIEARVAEARTRDPQLFTQVRGIRAYRAEGYRKLRSQRPGVVSLVFRRLGPGAVWALVELAALDGPARDGATDVEWNALRVGLLDAIGTAKEPAAAPVLRAAFERSADAPAQATAAIGLGLYGDAEVGLLLQHAVANDPLLHAAVSGLGASHSARAVERLGELLDHASGAATEELAAALGEAGSSWVWATGRVGSAAEGSSVRQVAAAALVRNYARLDEGSAHALEHALKRVDAPQAPALLAGAATQARAAGSADAAARLDQLATRLAARR